MSLLLTIYHGHQKFSWCSESNTTRKRNLNIKLLHVTTNFIHKNFVYIMKTCIFYLLSKSIHKKPKMPMPYSFEAVITNSSFWHITETLFSFVHSTICLPISFFYLFVSVCLSSKPLLNLHSSFQYQTLICKNTGLMKISNFFVII